MLELFSDPWIAALDEAVRRDGELAALAGEIDLVIQQTVTSDDGADRSYHLVLLADDLGVRPGSATDPTISFTTDRHTAEAIVNRHESAPSAFLDGRLRVGGDLRRLLGAQAALGRVADIFASVRATSEEGASSHEGAEELTGA